MRCHCWCSWTVTRKCVWNKGLFFGVYWISHTSGHVSNLTALGCPHHNLHIWMNFNASFFLSPDVSLTRYLFQQLLTHTHSTWLQLSVTIVLDAWVASIPANFGIEISSKISIILMKLIINGNLCIIAYYTWFIILYCNW
jgi:hypothetical protein